MVNKLYTIVRADNVASHLPNRGLTLRGNSFSKDEGKLTIGLLDKRTT